jgi:hypothetical protein
MAGRAAPPGSRQRPDLARRRAARGSARLPVIDLRSSQAACWRGTRLLLQQVTALPRPLTILRRPLAVSTCRFQLTGRRILFPALREQGCRPIMDFSRPLVCGGCVFKGGDEMRHAWSVRASNAASNRIGTCGSRSGPRFGACRNSIIWGQRAAAAVVSLRLRFDTGGSGSSAAGA